MYLQANVNTKIYTTTKANISKGKSVISIDIENKYFHALGAIHGSVYFKLLDDACFFAVNSLVEDAFVLTTSFNIHITKPVSSGKIEAVGKVRFKSKNLFTAEATLYKPIPYGIVEVGWTSMPFTNALASGGLVSSSGGTLFVRTLINLH